MPVLGASFVMSCSTDWRYLECERGLNPLPVFGATGSLLVLAAGAATSLVVTLHKVR